VIISWPAATEERGASVDGYQVLFYSHTNSDWEEYLVSCDGLDGTITTNKQCTVAMSVFTNSPFGYVNQLIQVQVKAKNSVGYGGLNQVNTVGVTGKVAPTVAPTLVVDSTTSSSVSLSWNAISSSPDNGGSPVTDYDIYWDSGAGTSNFVFLKSSGGATSTVHTSGVNSSGTYEYKILAVNAFGDGVLSVTPVSATAV
jgi:hypothetical protein